MFPHCHSIFFCYCADTVSQNLRNSNIFTIAKRNVEGQDMLYQSLKLTNGIKVLAELKIAPSNPNFTVSPSDIKYSGHELECTGTHPVRKQKMRMVWNTSA